MKTFIKYLLVLTCASCDIFDLKEPTPKTELEKLPPITQTGENTFGYLVNGKAVVFTSTLNFSAIYQGGFIQIAGGGVSLVIIDPIAPNQEYNIPESETFKARYTKEAQNGSYCFYEFENTYDGYIHFSKVDRVNHIASGTFQYSTVTQDCDTIRVTDGRFDMQYTP